ncbi:MAG: hypothetical protein ACR2MO_07985 [Acidimicrobiales bacterium]
MRPPPATERFLEDLVSYEPSERKYLKRFRRGVTGTETDTWALTAFNLGEDYYNILIGAGFVHEGPLCSAYTDGENFPGRIRMVDWITPDGPGGPVHHSANTSVTSPPGGSGWTVNHLRAAVVAVGGPVTMYVVTRGFGHYFTTDLVEANNQVSSGRFLAGPFPVFTCWN